MNPDRPNATSDAADESGGGDTSGAETASVELTEAELAIVQHALLNTHRWNIQEDDNYLAKRHNGIRVKMIDAHEEFLSPGGDSA